MNNFAQKLALIRLTVSEKMHLTDDRRLPHGNNSADTVKQGQISPRDPSQRVCVRVCTVTTLPG